ncbi:unnamed protein product [Rhizophagus irregularis]|nr:unnamed protein product [Rhizophagus irregularis]
MKVSSSVEVWQKIGILEKFQGIITIHIKNSINFIDLTNDKNALKNLFQLGFLNPYSSSIQNPSQIFWDYFAKSLTQNPRGGLDGIQQILSIIAHQFSYQELQNRFGVSLTTTVRPP